METKDGARLVVRNQGSARVKELVGVTESSKPLAQGTHTRQTKGEEGVPIPAEQAEANSWVEQRAN